MADWEEHAARATARHADGESRLPDDPDERQRQLTRMGNAAWAAGLSYLMARRDEDARVWLLRAAERYRESWADAPPDSWGRPIGALKSRLIAGDLEGARRDAGWALEAGAAESKSPIGRYAAVLASLVVRDDERALDLARTFQDAEAVPPAVTRAVAALASDDAAGYGDAIRALVADFEARSEFLEDTAVADTVLALQALARERGTAIELASPLLPD